MASIRSGLLFAFSLSLAACGGGSASGGIAASPAQTAIGGTVSGLPDGTTLLVTNGNLETLAIGANGNFAFGTKVAAGGDYQVTVLGQPSGVNCVLANGTGKVDANADPISNIAVVCTPVAVALVNFYVGVTISGLAQGNTVTFTNNGGDTLSATGNGLFVFSQVYAKEVVYMGQPGGYRVALQTDPKGQTCSLSNASGALSLSQSANFVNVPVACK